MFLPPLGEGARFLDSGLQVPVNLEKCGNHLQNSKSITEF